MLFIAEKPARQQRPIILITPQQALRLSLYDGFISPPDFRADPHRLHFPPMNNPYSARTTGFTDSGAGA